MSTDILASLIADPHQSSRHVAEIKGTCHQSVLKILKQHRFHPYKIQRHQTLSDDDFDRRIEFCEWALQKFDNNPYFPRDIIFSDEASFSVNGEVNKQNFRFWKQDNPHWSENVNLQGSPKIMVWCAIWNKRLIGPFFFNDSVTGESYLHMLVNDFLPAIQDLKTLDTYFQQDGAPAHYSLEVRTFLDKNFNGRWIGRRGSVEWPPRSPDITPLDFFLWGYLKSKVFVNRALTLDELRQKITQQCQQIPAEMFKNVQESWINRLRCCILQHGEQFEHLL